MGPSLLWKSRFTIFTMFLEMIGVRYDPRFQPFTSDAEGKFSFTEQPRAMFVNIQTLGKFSWNIVSSLLTAIGDCMKYLVRRSCSDDLSEEAHSAVLELNVVAEKDFWSCYNSYRCDVM